MPKKKRAWTGKCCCKSMKQDENKEHLKTADAGREARNPMGNPDLTIQNAADLDFQSPTGSTTPPPLNSNLAFTPLNHVAPATPMPAPQTP
jgi:hypothetical protein